MPALGGKTTEIWDKRGDHDQCGFGKTRRDNAARLKRAAREEAVVAHHPWPILCNDDRVLRAVDPVASVEALQALKKKHYEEERCNVNGARIPRCPFKGAGSYVHQNGVRRQRRSFKNSASPILFTIPNYLTPEDCERFITASESRGFQRHLPSWAGDYARGADSCAIYDKNESFQFDNHETFQLMWTSGLKAVFESIRVEGEEDSFAVGSPYFSVWRYENGDRCEPESNDELYRQPSRNSSNLYTFYGYSVLVYLNGGQADDARAPRDVVGGETHVFYPQEHLSRHSKQYIAKIAPEAGMAVCIVDGHQSPLHEIRPVVNGVLYMIEFRVQFSKFTEDIARNVKSQSRKGQEKN